VEHSSVAFFINNSHCVTLHLALHNVVYITTLGDTKPSMILQVKFLLLPLTEGVLNYFFLEVHSRTMVHPDRR